MNTTAKGTKPSLTGCACDDCQAHNARLLRLYASVDAALERESLRRSAENPFEKYEEIVK